MISQIQIIIDELYIHENSFGWAIWKCVAKDKMEFTFELILNYTGRTGGIQTFRNLHLESSGWREFTELDKVKYL